MLKLEILTAVANDNNVHTVLREFQYYVKNTDKEFVTASIQVFDGSVLGSSMGGSSNNSTRGGSMLAVCW